MNGTTRRQLLGFAAALTTVLPACQSTGQQAAQSPAAPPQVAGAATERPQIIRRPSPDVQRKSLRLSRGGGTSC